MRKRSFIGYASVLLLFLGAVSRASAPSTLPPYPPPQILPAEPGVCENFYPYNESANGVEGRTRLQFTVTEYGSVDDVKVVASSGNARLDDAAKSCLETKHYQPERKDGVLIAARFEQVIVWAIARPPALAEQSRDCPHEYGITASDLAGKSGSTDVRFSILDGVVRDTVVVQSSGNALLDRDASECVATRRFAKGSTGVFRERIFWVNGLPAKPGQVVRPQIVNPPHTCLSRYPLAAQRQGSEGVTVMHYMIGLDGRIKNLNVVNSSGDDHLDEAAMACVSEWLYWPVVVEGKAIEYPGEAEIGWHLH